MLIQGIPYPGGSGGAAGPPAGFTMASLFTGGALGAYYDFTDLSTLAVNADGSGGSPAIGGAAKWALDQSPNGVHLRNTVNNVAVVAGGISATGANYGLFNMDGFGNFPDIPEPFTIIARLEVLGYAGVDSRIIGGGPSGQILQGTAPDKVRLYSGYSPEVTIPLNEEDTLVAVFNAAASKIGVNDAALTTWASNGSPMANLCLASGTGGGTGAPVRFKRFFVREGVLSAGNLAGVKAWAAA